MKRNLFILLALLLSAITLASFGLFTNDNDTASMNNNYQPLWEKFQNHLDNSLPESAEKVLNSIEQKAEEENNQVQLLKTILYRRKVMMETIEEAPEEAYLTYALGQLERLDTVPRAVLHEEIAALYATYLNEYQYQIEENLAIDGSLEGVAMKYWDKRSFEDLIAKHYAEALKPLEALKGCPTNDYLCLFDSKHEQEVEYEPSMFDFLFHRVQKHYREAASADDLQSDWDTSLWWLVDTEFVKADLGDSDQPILRCLKLFQRLIADNEGDVRFFNDYKRYEFVNGILDEHVSFQNGLRALMEQNKDSKLYAQLANGLATDLIQQYDENPDDSTYSNNYQLAAQICRETIAAWPDDSFDCKSTLEYITYAHIAFTFDQVQLPNENIPVILEYRNVEHPTYKIVKVEQSELEELDKMDQIERAFMLDKRKAVAEGQFDLPSETDYQSHKAIVAISPLEEGIYYLLGIISKEETHTKSKHITDARFQVSKLGYIVDSQPEQLTVVTIDRKTGHPMAGVTVEATRRNYNYQKRKYETIHIATLVSNQEGRVVFTRKTGNDYFNITLKKDNDMLLPLESHHIDQASGPSSPYDRTRLFTDRAIYRPGQTVYFKGITVHGENGHETPASHLNEQIRFLDANWQEVAYAQFTTDEYGGFDGSFVIPTDLLNGKFQLQGHFGSTSFRVEEYKRPTFEINFETVKEQYKLNQEVTVHGSVDAYAGFGLDDIAYSYRVVRKTQFPWRCWWWWYPVVDDEQISFGEGRTDESGKFAVSFNLKPSLKTKAEQQPVFTYEIEVTATSAQGETHSDTYYIRAGYNEVALSTNLPSLVEQSETGQYHIAVVNMSGEPAKSRVARKIYRLDDKTGINYFEALHVDDNLDRQVLSDAILQERFPNYDFSTRQHKLEHKTLVFQDEVDIDNETPFYPGKQALKPGKYYIELKSLDDPLAQTAVEFTVYQKNSKRLPASSMTWYRTEKSTAKPGETVRFDLGSSARDVEMWVRLTHGNEVRMERWITLDNDIQSIEYTVTEEDRGGLNLQTFFVKENSYNPKNLGVQVPYDNLDLNVSLATVRDPLSPGAEETWTVNVKDYQGKPLEAALLAGMYDVSLDEFAYHHWSFSMSPGNVGSTSFRGDRHQFLNTSTRQDQLLVLALFDLSLPSDYPFFEVYTYRMRGFGGKGGRFLYRDMDDGVMYEIAMSQQQEAPGAIAMNTSIDEESADMAVSKESSNQETEEVATQAEHTEPALRENFNETAFFFPNLRTEADGSSTFTFTMPDAITRWKLMMIAYDREGKTGQKEYSFKTSKPVMIMADMPRYLYDTDSLWFVANVINTSDEAVTPTAKLEVFDAATMRPLDLVVSEPVVTLEEIVPGRSKEVRWKVAAQYDLSLLALRFTAYAGTFSDAEQHLLPVLSSEIFMTQTLPITVKANSEKTFDFEAIANPDSHERDHSLTLNFSTNPVWYAVQSLPYLANVRTDTPEGAFYAFYANSLSAYIADHVPNLLAYIKRWQIETPDALLSQLEKDQDLKAILLQETPWVLEAKSETEQRARIANLFELNTLRQQQHATLELLEKRQKYNGGWPWREGMPESAYITNYILSGMGRLKQMGVWESLSASDRQKAENICARAVRFIEYDVADYYREMKKLEKEWGIGGFTLSELYALSFFEEQKSDKDFDSAKKYFIDRLDNKKEWTAFNFNYRSFAAVVLHRYGHEETAKLLLQSFRECAQKNEELGMYWPKKYFSFISHVATHANIMAAFAEIEGDQELIDQMRVWLLTQKRTNLWENSSSTADAIYALLMRGSDWFEEGKDVSLSFSGMPISTEGGEAGTGFIQRHWNANEVTEAMRHLTVNNPTGHLVWGGLFRQYFVPIDEVKSDQSGFKIKRELFVETVTENGKLLVPVKKQTLQVGDKLTVKLTFECPQDMSCVFVKDLRAAGFEPIEQVSRYECGDDLCYYQSNTDTDMEFFIDFLRKGTHQLQYSLYVTKEGALSNGYALIQCQYAPEFSAYSDGMRVKVGM